MVRDNQVEADELVVCIVTGSGLKDIGNAQTVVGEPQIIEPSLDAVRTQIGKCLGTS